MNTPTSTQTTTVNVTMALASDVAARLSQVASKTGQTLEAVLVTLAEKGAKDANDISGDQDHPFWKKSIEERIADFDRWCKSHKPVHHFVDDSRESIYAGRGE